MGLVHVHRCAYKHFSFVLCCEGFLKPASFTQRDEAQRIDVQCGVSVSGRSFTHLHSPFSSPFLNTFTPCDSRLCSLASTLLLSPRRFGELMLPYCLLSWAGQRAPIYLLYELLSGVYV